MVSKKKKKYDFLVAIPGFPLPFGVRAHNESNAHKTIMEALLQKGRATRFIPFNKCQVYTQKLNVSHAKSGIVTRMEF